MVHTWLIFACFCVVSSAKINGEQQKVGMNYGKNLAKIFNILKVKIDAEI